VAFDFRWNHSNVDHIAQHNVAPEEVVYIFSPPGVVYVLHASWLDEREKRLLWRRRK
jgi:hypothetical protein